MAQEDVPTDVISSLDFVYLASDYLIIEPLRGIIHNVGEKSERIEAGDKKLEDLVVFAAILCEDNITHYNPTPLFSFGKPETREDSLGEKKYTRHNGLFPIRFEEGYLVLQKDFKAEVDVFSDGSVSVFIGCGEYLDVYIFETPLQFDPSKQLFFYRSPNNKLKLEKLGSGEFREIYRSILDDTSPKMPYQLAYANLKALKEQCTWAITHKDIGITRERNPQI